MSDPDPSCSAPERDVNAPWGHSSGTDLPELASVPPVLATPAVGGLLTVPVLIDGIEAVAVIDTGARAARINWRLGRLLGLSPETAAPGAAIQGATNNGVATAQARVARVELGERRLLDQPVLVADLPVFEVFGVADRPAVILGLDWLARTRLLVDFPLRKVWFVPSELGSALSTQ